MVGLSKSAMKNIPLYVPPGATENAAYGVAGPDFLYPVLSKGTGMEPKWKFDSTVSALDAVITLVANGT
jgi:hypothetical protein